MQILSIRRLSQISPRTSPSHRNAALRPSMTGHFLIQTFFCTVLPPANLYEFAPRFLFLHAC